MLYPYLRKAEDRDYQALWEIWMQDHVIKWMSFTKTKTPQEFRKKYDSLAKASDIYVLIDKIEGEEKVVGVRRMKIGKGPLQHIAEYCSMGVSNKFQGKGYAKALYKGFEDIARQAGIKRVQLTQSGGNEAAFHLADINFSFSEEALFPDWLQRSEKGGDYYLIERYIYRFLDEDFAQTAYKLPSLKYEETVPSLVGTAENKDITIEKNGDQFICHFQGKPLLTVNYEPDDSVIRHIGFLSIQLHSDQHPSVALAGLRNVLLTILESGQVKKLDLFTENPKVAEICKAAGFFVRGEKIASYYENGEYKNELATEYSFFGVDDAKKLVLAKVSDATKRERIDETMTECSSIINSLKENNKYDELGARYLENIVYQIVRDDLAGLKVFSLADKRWTRILPQLPRELHDSLSRLQNCLKGDTPTFFKSGTEKNQSERDTAALDKTESQQQHTSRR